MIAMDAPARLSPNQWAILAMIFATALGLRLHNLGAQSFWFDELQSMQSTTGHGWVQEKLPTGQWIENAPRLGTLNRAAPCWRIWTSLDVEVLPPLYYVVLRFWRELFGDNEAVVRSLSMLFSLGSIGLLFACARILFNVTAALWAAALMAVAVPQVLFAQEARCYAMATFFSLATLLSALSILRDGPIARRIALLSLCTCATMLTHYFAFGAILAIFVFTIVRSRAKSRQAVLTACGIAVVVYAVIWGPFLLKQRANFQRDTLAFQDTKTNHLGAALTDAGEASLRQLGGASIGQTSTSILVAGATFATIWLSRRRPNLLLPQLWIILALGILLILDLATSTTVISLLRYTTLAAPGVFLLIAAAPEPNRWLRHLVPAGALVCCIVSLPGAYTTWKGDWAALGNYLNAHAPPSQPIVISRFGHGWTPGGKYLNLSFYDPSWSHPIVLINEGQQPNSDAIDRLHHFPTVWVVTDHHTVEPGRALPGVVPVDMIHRDGAATIWRTVWSAPTTQP